MVVRDESELLKALARAERGGSTAQVGNALDHLAEHYHRSNAFGQATPIYRRALVIWQQLLGPEHPTVATLLVNLGHAHVQLKELEAAGPVLRKALAIYEADGLIEDSGAIETFEAYARALEQSGNPHLSAQFTSRIKRLTPELVAAPVRARS